MEKFSKLFRLCIITLAIAGTGFYYSLSAQESGTIQTATSRVVEDGGTGANSAIMYTDALLTTHTIFLPKDLSVF